MPQVFYSYLFWVELYTYVLGTIIDWKNVPPPCNHLNIGALRLPTLARNQAGDLHWEK